MKFCLLLTLLLFTQCQGKNKELPWTGEADPPASILAVHAELLKQLGNFTPHRDSTGRVAKKLYDLLAHHFEEEERHLLPVLGLLPELANGTPPRDAEGALRNIEWYRKNVQHLQAEHQFIKAIMLELVAAAGSDGHHGAGEFESALMQHAAEEDEVLFPAVLLTGLYLEKIRD